MFTPFFLQDVLAQELEGIFEKDRFLNKKGDLVKLNVYKQFLPVDEAGSADGRQEELESALLDDSQEQEPFPYILVILPDGKASTRQNMGTVNVLLYIGMWDEDKMRNGYQNVLHVIQMVCERFQKNSVVDGFHCKETIEWETSLMDEHPAYFGAIGMEFEIMRLNKEDDYC